MPEDSSLHLLDSAARVSAEIYHQIDASMSKNLEIQAQQGRFEVDANFKAAQFAEEQRMNAAQVDSMQEQNRIRAAQFQMDRELMPLKIQSANLQLEAAKFNFQRQKEQSNNQMFDQIAGIHDDRIGFDLLQTESADQAKEYLDYKAKVKAYVAQGGSFDDAKYQQGLDVIRNKYKGVKPDEANSEYSPEKQYLFDSISPKLGQSYGLRHPTIQGSRNALATSFYSLTDSEVDTYTAKYGKLYKDDEWAQLHMGRDVVKNNKQNIKEWSQEESRLQNAYSIASAQGADKANLEEVKKQIGFYQKNISDALDQNQTLYRNSALGKYGPQKELPIIVLPQNQNVPKISPKAYMNPDDTLGILAASDSNSTGKQMKEGVDKTWHSITKGKEKIEDTELANVNLSWWNQHSSGDEPNDAAKSMMKSNVEQRLDSMDVEKRFTRERAADLLSTIKSDVQVPLSGWLRDVISHSTEISIPRNAGEFVETGDTYYITFGKEKKGIMSTFANRNIHSPEQLFEVVNSIRNNAEREEAQKELYAALITASLSSGLTDKSKK